MKPSWRDGIHASRDQPIEKIVKVAQADSVYVLDNSGDIFVSRVMMVGTDGMVSFQPIDQDFAVTLPLRGAIWYPHATSLVMSSGTSSVDIWLGS